MRLVTVLSYPRTGSNRLFDLLSGVASSVCLGEIFHPSPSAAAGQFWEDKIVSAFGSVESFSTIKADDPVEALQVLLRGSDADVAFLKVFPGHLPGESLERLVASSEAVVRLSRNPLASWVSNCLAVSIQQWSSVDTTAYRVPWDAASFSHYVEYCLTHVLAGEQFARAAGVPLIRRNYTDLCGLRGPGQLWRSLASELPSLPSYRRDPAWSPSIRRQDRRRPINRLTNPHEARCALQAFKLGGLAADREPVDLFECIPLARIMSATQHQLASHAVLACS